MERFVIDLPHPPEEVRANAGLHPRWKASAIAKAREDARKVAVDRLAKLHAQPPHWKYINVHVHYRWTDRNHMQDTDNAGYACKPYIDGLKRYISHAKKIKNTGMVIPAIEGAGVIANDDCIMEWKVTWGIDKEHPGVRIVITPVSIEKVAA